MISRFIKSKSAAWRWWNGFFPLHFFLFLIKSDVSWAFFLSIIMHKHKREARIKIEITSSKVNIESENGSKFA